MTDKDSSNGTPQLEIISGSFKDIPVLITDKEILDNYENLNYNSVMKDSFLTKEQRRYKRGKIIEMATAFYKENKAHYEDQPSKAPSVSGVADFFHIPRQSFSDHIKGNHKNIALNGPSRKSLMGDDSVDILRKIVMHLRVNEDPGYDIRVLKSTDKELINLMALYMMKTDGTSNPQTFSQISEQLGLLDSKHHSEEVVHQRDVYGRLISFFQNPLLCTETFKLKSKDIDEILAALIEIKTVYSAQKDVKKLSRRTISRSRAKLGILPMNTKTRDTSSEDTSILNESMNTSMNATQLMESFADAAVTLDNRNILGQTDDESDHATSTTVEQTTDEKIQSVFKQMNQIIDNPGEKTLDSFKEYRKLVNDLLVPLNAMSQYGPQVGEQFKKLTDFIFKLSFENTVLMQQNGGQPMLTPTARMTEQRKRSLEEEEAEKQSAKKAKQ